MLKVKVDLFDAIANSVAVLISDGNALPDNIKTAVIEANKLHSPVEKVVEIGEALYSARDKLTNPLREVCAQCFDLMREHGWQHPQAGDDRERAGAVIRVMQRDAGETAPQGAAWPKAGAEPSPVAKFAPAGDDEGDAGANAPEAT